MSTSNKTIHRRFWEIFPIAFSLCILLLPVFFSFYVPIIVAVFVVIYSFLWLLRAVEYAGFLLYSFRKFHKISKINWRQKLRNIESQEHLNEKEVKKINTLISQDDFTYPSSVKHIVIIATCGEQVNILRESIKSIAESDYNLENIYVCLATEERKSKSGRENAAILQKEFDPIFGRFYWSEHPDGIPGEVRGKGGNITYAGKIICEDLEQEGADLSNFLVTTLDADNKVDRNYFASLTYHYCLQEKRQKKSYQPLPLFYNNIWDVPILNRMMGISSGFWHMIESGRPDRLRNFSSHAQPLLALKEMDFWAVDTIVEDGHQFWRSYLHFDGDYEVIPLFIPIYQDAVLNKNYYRSLVGQYKQMRRWAWGCSDIPFCAEAFWKKRKTLPTFRTCIHFIRLIEGHIMWSTAAIFITLTTPIPRMINSNFRDTTISVNMAFLMQNFFVIAFCGIMISMAISLITLPKAPNRKKNFSLVWQWIFLPIVTIIMGSFPAIDAQTRLAINKPLEFNITEKVRKKKKK